MNAMPDFVELMIAEAAESIQVNFETVERAYNKRVDAAFAEANAFARTSLEEIRSKETHHANISREIERSGLPKLNDGKDDKGVQKFKTDDPRPRLKEEIKKLKAARNARMSERGPGRIDLVAWLKTQRGQVLIAAPALKPLPDETNFAEAFDNASLATDGALSAYKRTLTAKLPTEEALAKWRAYVDWSAKKGEPSMYAFFAPGQWNSRGHFSEAKGIARPEFVTQQVGWEGNLPVEIEVVQHVICWATRDTTLAAGEKSIRAKGNDADAIPAAERPARLAKAADAVLAAMRHEAHVGLECVRRRIPISLRRIIPPWVYLGIDRPAHDAVQWEPRS